MTPTQIANVGIHIATVRVDDPTVMISLLAIVLLFHIIHGFEWDTRHTQTFNTARPWKPLNICNSYEASDEATISFHADDDHVRVDMTAEQNDDEISQYQYRRYIGTSEACCKQH